MEPQNDNEQAQVKPEVIHLQEQFSEQVEDTSRLADQVLSEQKETRQDDGRALLFVP